MSSEPRDSVAGRCLPVCREMAACLSPLTKGVIPGCVGDRLHTCFLLHILELVFDAPVPGGMKQRELILLPPEHLQLNSKLHDTFHMLPCHLVLIRHDLYLMLKATATVNSCVSHIDNTVTGLRLGPAVLTSSWPHKLGS